MYSHLKELQKEKNRFDKAFRKELKRKLRGKQNNSMILDELELKYRPREMRDSFDMSIEFALVQDFKIKLQKYHSYISSDEKYWTTNEHGAKYLSDEGKEHCAKKLRELKKESREAFVQYSSALTGIMGFITAIVAIIVK